jgi:hypothetical protein
MRAPRRPPDPAKRFRDHQVDRHAVSREPTARLAVDEVTVESGYRHGRFQQWAFAEFPRVQYDVAVLGRFGQRQVDGAGV